MQCRAQLRGKKVFDRLDGPGRLVAFIQMEPMPGIEQGTNGKVLRRAAFNHRDCPLIISLKLRVSKFHNAPIIRHLRQVGCGIGIDSCEMFIGIFFETYIGEYVSKASDLSKIIKFCLVPPFAMAWRSGQDRSCGRETWEFLTSSSNAFRDCCRIVTWLTFL